MIQENYEMLVNALFGDKPSDEDMWEILNVFRRLSDIRFTRCSARFNRNVGGSNRLGIDIVMESGIIFCIHTDIGPNNYEDWYIGDSSYTVWNGRQMLISDYGWLDDTLLFMKILESRMDEYKKLYNTLRPNECFDKIWKKKKD